MDHLQRLHLHDGAREQVPHVVVDLACDAAALGQRGQLHLQVLLLAQPAVLLLQRERRLLHAVAQAAVGGLLGLGAMDAIRQQERQRAAQQQHERGGKRQAHGRGQRRQRPARAHRGMVVPRKIVHREGQKQREGRQCERDEGKRQRRQRRETLRKHLGSRRNHHGHEQGHEQQGLPRHDGEARQTADEHDGFVDDSFHGPMVAGRAPPQPRDAPKEDCSLLRSSGTSFPVVIPSGVPPPVVILSERSESKDLRERETSFAEDPSTRFARSG